MYYLINIHHTLNSVRGPFNTLQDAEHRLIQLTVLGEDGWIVTKTIGEKRLKNAFNR